MFEIHNYNLLSISQLLVHLFLLTCHNRIITLLCCLHVLVVGYILRACSVSRLSFANIIGKTSQESPTHQDQFREMSQHVLPARYALCSCVCVCVCVNVFDWGSALLHFNSSADSVHTIFWA